MALARHWARQRAHGSSRAWRSTGVLTHRGAVCGVRTAHGDIVGRGGGQLRRRLGSPARAPQAGVNVPLQAAEHYYLITERSPAWSRSWPVLEDPASYGYFREEGAA
jgi:hypothetical protein